MCTFCAVSSRNGTFVHTPSFCAISCISNHISVYHGSTAPSLIEMESSSTSVDSSTTRTMPVSPHSAHTPPCVGGQHLDVAPRALRVEHAKCERGFCRAGDGRNSHDLVQRYIHGYIFQIAYLDRRGDFVSILPRCTHLCLSCPYSFL